ncbi:MAG TPA: hypothetical protein VIJ42_07470 [Stellaceae bacterium]
MKITSRVLATLLMLTLAAPALAQAISPPAVKAGDRWVYDGPDGKRSLHVDSVSGDGTIDATIDAPGLSGLAMRYTKDWNVMMAPVPMLGTIHYQRYRPPLCVMPPSPWSAGQTWSCDTGWSDGTYSGTIQLAGKIDGIEKITVPAGTFDAVHARLNVGGTEVNCWFAPQVGNWVQCKSPLPDYNYALKSYSLK